MSEEINMVGTEKHREIESKFWLDAEYIEATKLMVEYYLKVVGITESDILYATTRDDYWEVPGKGDFLRLRNSSGEYMDGNKKTLKEITVKAKDKGCNLDRMEINVSVEKILDTRKLLNTVLGNKPVGSINKHEAIVFAPKGVVVSICGFTDGKVLLEVEGPSVAEIKLHERPLRRLFGMKSEEASLFELYISPKLEGKNEEVA